MGELNFTGTLESFRALERQYGAQPVLVNRAARYACAADRHDAALELFKALGDDWLAGIWGYKETYERWRKWADRRVDPPPPDYVPW